MHIVMIGTGYVGLVTGSCFAEMGHTVTCLDIDREKITRLQKGEIPIYEPGLQEMVVRTSRDGRLHFTTDYASCIPTADACFFALPTPSSDDGSCDLSYVYEAAETIAPLLSEYTVVVMKSTVPVGTGKAIQKHIAQKAPDAAFDIVSNPEFLKEGSAVEDCMKPSRVVIGVESEQAKKIMARIYSGFTRNHNRILFMDVPSAEITKYAANAMLATRISFMNELSVLCEQVGADISSVRTGIGSDERIGYDFLYAGPGFGGSCFPKDLRAILYSAESLNIPLDIVRAALQANQRQKTRLFKKAILHFETRGGITGKRCAVWGLSFKPNTDDIRESPAVALIEQLLEAGVRVTVYDPIATKAAQAVLPKHSNLQYASDQYTACEDADALFLMTEWKQFRFPNFSRIQELLKQPVLFDGRNQYDPEELAKQGFIYYGIGRPEKPEQLLEALSLRGSSAQRT